MLSLPLHGEAKGLEAETEVACQQLKSLWARGFGDKLMKEEGTTGGHVEKAPPCTNRYLAFTIVFHFTQSKCLQELHVTASG